MWNCSLITHEVFILINIFPHIVLYKLCQCPSSGMHGGTYFIVWLIELKQLGPPPVQQVRRDSLHSLHCKLLLLKSRLC